MAKVSHSNPDLTQPLGHEVVLVVTHVYPPIPSRHFDWCAYQDGEEESGNYGWGKTDIEAIYDWKEQYGEYDRVKSSKGSGE